MNHAQALAIARILVARAAGHDLMRLIAAELQAAYRHGRKHGLTWMREHCAAACEATASASGTGESTALRGVARSLRQIAVGDL